MQGYGRLEALLARHWPELSSVVNIYDTTWRLLEAGPARDRRAVAEGGSSAHCGALGAASIEAILPCATRLASRRPGWRGRRCSASVSEMLRHREEVREVDRKLPRAAGVAPRARAMARWWGW